MRMAVGLPMLRLMISGQAGFAALDVKTPTDEHPIAGAFHPAGDALEQGSAKTQVLLEARLEVRRQIDEPGDEHVAREAADEIKMNIQVPAHHPLETRNLDRSKVTMAEIP